MACSEVSCFFILHLLHIGAAAVVQTPLNVLAAEGEDAPLSCQLLETKEVQQVTWQKVFGRKERNICSYSEYFGQTVNPDFKDKVQFTEAGLKNSSIVIRKVTEQDEGCYLCLFNIYPDGALIGRTCLKAYELHEPVLDVSRSNVSAESVVSCSATGRPAPTVTLTVLQQNLSFSHYNSSSVTHSNGTVTVTTTAPLSAFSSTQVGCSVSVLSAAPREKLITVPGFKGTSDDGQSASSYSKTLIIIIIPLIAVSACIFIISFIILFVKQRKKNRDPEWNKTPVKLLQDTNGMQTPSIRLENQARLRSAAKGSKRKRPESSPSEAEGHVEDTVFTTLTF